MAANPFHAPKLLDQVRGKIRLKHYSIRTEQAYVDWIKRFILHFDKRHPRELGAAEVEAFLTHLAVAGNVAAATQNQAKSALLFLYREVLETELPWLDNVERARAPKRLPVVLTREEVQGVLGRLTGTHWLIASLLYGAGLRIMEGLRLRVKDVEFSRREILVRDGKGFKDRVTMLPAALAAPLAEHLKRVKALHEQDLAAGRGAVSACDTGASRCRTRVHRHGACRRTPYPPPYMTKGRTASAARPFVSSEAWSYQSNFTPNFAIRGPSTVVARSNDEPPRQLMLTAVFEFVRLNTSTNTAARALLPKRIRFSARMSTSATVS